ncbi:hypothetical protein [Sulfobacillus thermosulfidooxidans]|uniref:hypothetical protein n=1 Tax=Sulfobacillus thermosulfidooxidans TaxID=28034 RepID=UPI001111DDC3|nr:hypothetical protein [Sulfobacillus thermosulfidooxidans]
MVESLPIIGTNIKSRQADSHHVPWLKRLMRENHCSVSTAKLGQFREDHGSLQVYGRYQYGYEGDTLTIDKYSPGTIARQ